MLLKSNRSKSTDRPSFPVSQRVYFCVCGAIAIMLGALAVAPYYNGTGKFVVGSEAGVVPATAIRPVRFLDEGDEAEPSLQEKMQRLDAMTVDQLQKEFDENIQLWRDNFAKLAQGQTAFYNRPEEESGQWARQFHAARRDGEAARKAAGLAAVVLAERIEGDLDPDLATMVYYSMDEFVVFEKFHLAYRAGKALSESNAKNGPVLAVTGYAAYCTNRFEEARQYFSEALVEGYELPPEYTQVNQTLDDAVAVMETEKKRREESGENPIATIETTKGTLVVELLEDQAPNTVASFINLAEAHFYDGQEFYDTNVAYVTTGSPTNRPDGNAGYEISSESDRDNSAARLRGSLILMVVPDLGVGSSQFSILTQPMVDLVGSQNTVFGRVVEGELVLDDIARVGEQWQEFAKKTRQPLPAADRIKSITISKKRDHVYEVKKFGQK